MSDITLKAIEELLDSKLEPIKTTLDAHSEVLASHTQILDTILKNTSNWQVEMTVMRETTF